jgi:Xaa-Pro dipeptidase
MPDTAPIIVLPELEQEKIKNLPYEIQAFPYGEDTSLWSNVYKQAVQAAKLENKRNGVEPRHLRFLEYQLLSDAGTNAGLISAENIIFQLRVFKDQSEISAMRKAAEIAEQALKSTLPNIKLGLSELELAAELTLQLIRAGCDPQIPFAPIVSSGPNSANPHATPSDRKLSMGDLLVIDWGASYDGYYSDITRTFGIGEMEPEFDQICKVILEANSAARKSACPGISAEVVDQAARQVIEAAGFGKYFTHRTGHGLGMEAHEDPYIRNGNLMLLEPGMTFTIEPGIYLSGRNGVRIEDDVVITPTGSDCLTSLPREVRQLI